MRGSFDLPFLPRSNYIACYANGIWYFWIRSDIWYLAIVGLRFDSCQCTAVPGRSMPCMTTFTICGPVLLCSVLSEWMEHRFGVSHSSWRGAKRRRAVRPPFGGKSLPCPWFSRHGHARTSLLGILAFWGDFPVCRRICLCSPFFRCCCLDFSLFRCFGFSLPA